MYYNENMNTNKVGVGTRLHVFFLSLMCIAAYTTNT